MKEAMFYQKLDQNQLVCNLCPHQCTLSDGKIGICGVRQNQSGVLYSLVYEKAIATHVDPIEKKPLFHVYPGTDSFSIATVGCNFKCEFCQNHDISQIPREVKGYLPGDIISAEKVVQYAKRYDCKTIACTYTEPTIYYEYAFDIAVKAKEYDVDTVFVTNGYTNEEPIRQIAPYLTAANVDLKGWDEKFYQRMVGGKLEYVLATLRLLKKLGIWLEVTTLVVPGYVDDEVTLRQIALFIKNELGAETPWHISRFYPQYHCIDHSPTSVSILRRAREIGLEVGLRYVYSGNVPGDVGEKTFCYSCGELLIDRYGFEVMSNKITNECCPFCGVKIDGIGMSF